MISISVIQIIIPSTLFRLFVVGPSFAFACCVLFFSWSLVLLCIDIRADCYLFPGQYPVLINSRIVALFDGFDFWSVDVKCWIAWNKSNLMSSCCPKILNE